MRCTTCGRDRDLGECICATAPAPIGWYSDPSGSGSLRWWNGFGWTDDVRPATAVAQGYAVVPRERAGGSKRRPLVGVVTTVALIAGVVGGGFLLTGSGPAKRVAWAPGVAPIAQFVEKERGLTFRHPVAVEFLADAQFEAKVGGGGRTQTSAERAQLDDSLSEMRALGLMHGSIDLGAAARQMTQDRAIGLYVPHDKVVYVRGTALTPAVRVTLAHELTHALQDQHVSLQHLNSEPDADQSAVRALVEGDAVRVERAYEATLSEADHQTYIDTEDAAFSHASAADQSLPVFMENQFEFPYAFGPMFVQALVAKDGNAGIDRALINPPTVDAQVVDPSRYLAGDVPAHVDTPSLPASAHLLDRAPFGLVSLLEVVGDVAGYQAAWDGLQGWQGDVAVGYRSAGQVCMVIDTKMATTARAVASATVAASWAATIPGATATATNDILELRACDPGSAHLAAAAADPQPFNVLVVRAGIIGELLTAHVSLPIATCATDRLIVTVGAAQIAALNDSTAQPGDGTATKVTQAIGSAVTACGSTLPPG